MLKSLQIQLIVKIAKFLNQFKISQCLTLFELKLAFKVSRSDLESKDF
jgi:hypothetical protein